MDEKEQEEIPRKTEMSSPEKEDYRISYVA